MEVFDTDRGKIAIQVCYDIEFPESRRIAVERGARIIFVPFCTDERYAYLRVRYCAQARCIENHVYVAIAGSVGNFPTSRRLGIHYAQSGIFTPSDIPFMRDAIAAECTPNIETVIFEDLDLELLKRQRQSGSVLNWSDRRSDLYQVNYSPPQEPDETEQPVAGLSELIGEENVSLALQAKDRDAVLRDMAELTFGRGTDVAERTFERLLQRERVSTTAVGNGVAIPHCRSPDVQRIRLAIGFSAQGIDFQASGGAPVHVVLSVVSPVDAASHHLGTLSRLATLLRAEETTAKLRQARDPREVIAFLREHDEQYERDLAQRRAGAVRNRSGSSTDAPSSQSRQGALPPLSTG